MVPFSNSFRIFFLISWLRLGLASNSFYIHTSKRAIGFSYFVYFTFWMHFDTNQKSNIMRKHDISPLIQMLDLNTRFYIGLVNTKKTKGSNNSPSNHFNIRWRSENVFKYLWTNLRIKQEVLINLTSAPLNINKLEAFIKMQFEEHFNITYEVFSMVV